MNALRRKYLALLVALLVLLIIYPICREFVEGRLLLDALLAIVFAAVFWAIVSRRQRIIAVVLGVPTLVGLWVDYAVPGLPRFPLAVSFHVAAALFLGFAVYSILRAIYEEDEITTDNIHGALCGYLLIGLTFGHIYCLVESLVPGSFRVGGELLTQAADAGLVHFQLTYFSFVTLSTVGYGDIIPAKQVARSLAVVEAIIGQFYVAVLLAELIGKRAARS